MEEQLKNIAISAMKYLSVGAIFSFITYWHSHRKDRAILKTSSRFWKQYKYEGREFPSTIQVKVVNAGRRPIILTGLYFKHEDGTTHGEAINHPNGLTLKENEMWQNDFQMDSSSLLYCCENDTGAEDAWFVDTQDRKYYVKDAKRTLKRFWKCQKEIYEREKKELASRMAGQGHGK